MGNTEAFVSRDEKLRQAIEDEVGKLRAANPLELPAARSELSQLYVRKIEGTYNVERAKTDTDHAIDLLYIAYNTTPQNEDDIRNKIAGIMNRLVAAQHESERAMGSAMSAAADVLGSLRVIFPDWQDVRGCAGPDDADCVAEVKDFVKTDILVIAKKIKDKALSVKKELDGIAAIYEGIIKDTVIATSGSETALANRLRDKAAVEKEISETNAKREQLEELVKDLQSEVAKYEKMARDYESRANTAEERAFIMSIVQVGAQMLASTIPAAVTAATGAATGGASLIASAAANTVNRALGDKNGDAKGDTDADAQAIDLKKKISDKKTEVVASEKIISELKEKVTALEKDLEKEEKKEAKSKGSGGESAEASGGAGKGKDEGGQGVSEVAKGLRTRIAATKEELSSEEARYAALIGTLSGFQASLVALDKGLGRLTEKQESTAASLREMQMRMLDKVELYEKERRSQNAELVKINALLKGKRSEEETIHLTIQSLNVSLSALKRTREIITEIAFFFSSFANFMDLVGKESVLDIELFDRVVGRDKIRANAFQGLLQGVDKFFLRQAAEWNAVNVVADKFCKSFADGWSKLNKLSGKYITGSELEAYLKTASLRLEEIVADRDQASDQKILDLERYRQQLRDSAAAVA